MARPPNKRRGITLSPHADSASSLDLLDVQPLASASVSPDETGSAPESAGGAPDAIPEAMEGLLAQFRLMTADIDMRWQRQVEESQKQLRQLEQQRDQIALQLRQLQALHWKRQTSHWRGVLMALLTLAGVAALGVHTWPQLRDVAGDLNRMSTGIDQIDPQLQAVNARLASLTSEMGQVDGAMASLREDFSGVRSDVGSLRQVVSTLSKSKGTAGAGSTGPRRAAHTLPRNATAMSNRYRAMRPPRPW